MVAHVTLEGQHATTRQALGGHVDQHGAGVTDQVLGVERRAVRRRRVDEQAHCPQGVNQESSLTGRAFDHQHPRRTLDDHVRPRAVVLDLRVLVRLKLQTQHVMAVRQRLHRQDEATRTRLDVHVQAAREATIDHQIQRGRGRDVGFDLRADREPLAFPQLGRTIKGTHQHLRAAHGLERQGQDLNA